jgi:hypothetical protein
MKQSSFWLLLLALLVGGGAFYFWQYIHEKPNQDQQSAIETQPPPSVQGSQEPEVLYPVPKTPLPIDTPDTEPSAEEEPPLPPLDDSDPVFEKEFGNLFDQTLFGKLFIFKMFAHRFVVTVDNLTAPKLPQKFQVTNPPPGYFLANKDAEERQFVDPSNYRRYDVYVQFVQSIDIKTISSVYVRYYPLFQEAYENLGYPNQYFNDRLIEVIDHLLAAPDVTTPVELVRPSVYYKFADPDLEGLSAGQKILIRIGYDNAFKVKSKLRELRQVLTTLTSNL